MAHLLTHILFAVPSHSHCPISCLLSQYPVYCLMSYLVSHAVYIVQSSVYCCISYLLSHLMSTVQCHVYNPISCLLSHLMSSVQSHVYCPISCLLSHIRYHVSSAFLSVQSLSTLPSPIFPVHHYLSSPGWSYGPLDCTPWPCYYDNNVSTVDNKSFILKLLLLGFSLIFWVQPLIKSSSGCHRCDVVCCAVLWYGVMWCNGGVMWCGVMWCNVVF